MNFFLLIFRKSTFFMVFFLFFFLLTSQETKASQETKIENQKIKIEKKGKALFFENCLACHKEKENIIIPEKNLKKEALENNGMNNREAIMYQVINGKNGMPAFGGRLKEMEVEKIADYILEE